MAISNPTGSEGSDSPEALRKTIRDLTDRVQSLQTQANTAPSFIGVTDKFPNGAPAGSMAARQLSNGQIAVSLATGKGFGKEVVIGGSSSTSYQGVQSGTTPPSVTQFSSDGAYGWYLNTATSAVYWAVNIGGTLRFPAFASISGTITDTQHGIRGGGSLHSAATSSTNGFYAAIDKVANDIAAAKVSDITDTGTPSFTVNATSFYVGGVQVLTAQLPSQAALSGSATLTDVINYLTVQRGNLISVHLQHA